MRPQAMRILAAVTAFSLLSPAVASAGPDDGKFVVTSTHVDAPEAIWNTATNSIDLKVSHGHDQIKNFEDVVLYTTKGWKGGVNPTGGQLYQLEVPDHVMFKEFTDVAPNSVFYLAPVLAGARNHPIFWGVGSKGLPLEQFRDNVVSLNLESVNGPGIVEFFNYTLEEDFEVMSRMLTSTAHGPRSFALDQANYHTHNNTAFSRPGRYELNFSVTAKTTEGALIKDARKLVVQVGGTKPKEQASQSINEKFAAATNPAPKAGDYVLKIAPLQENRDARQVRDGDKNLEVVKFEAKDKNVNGTLTLLNQGYHLADIDVKNGQASFEELFGTDPSDIQAIFIPEGDTAPKWVSPALSRTFRGTAEVSSDDGNQQIMAEKNDPRNVAADTSQYSPGDLNANIKFTREETGGDYNFVKLSIDVDNPQFDGWLLGRFTESPRATKGGEPFAIPITNGKGLKYSIEDDIDGKYASFTVVPHTYFANKATNYFLETPLSFEDSGEFVVPTISVKSETPAVTPPTETSTPTVTPTPPAVNPPATPGKGQRCEGSVLLDKGHTDLLVRKEGEFFKAFIKDDTAVDTVESKEREIDSVINVLGESALTRRSHLLLDKKLDFVGPKDAPIYLAPEVQRPDVLWPGYNTQELDMDEFDGPVTLHMDPVVMPKDAVFALFKDKNFTSDLEVLVNSTTKDSTIEIPDASHVHINWLMTKPGVYTFNTYYSARTKNGKTITSTPKRMTYAVGLENNEICDAVKQVWGGGTQPPATSTETPKPPATSTQAPKPPATSTQTPKPPAASTEAPKPPATSSQTPNPPKDEKKLNPAAIAAIVLTVLAVVGGIVAAAFNPTIVNMVKNFINGLRP